MCGILSLLTVCLLAAAVPAAAADLPFTLPVPDGWRTETIAFPLGFAPSLPYTGLEELRFAPGMFVPGAVDFWTYAFCWWVPEGTPLDSRLLEQDLQAYFAGLAAAVAEAEHFEAERPHYAADLLPVRTAVGEPQRWEGKVETFDAFASRGQVILNAVIEAVPCPDAAMTAVLFRLSPQPAGHPVWKTLAQIRAGFSCLPAD